MYRGWTIGIVCLAITSSAASVGLAQQGRPQNSDGLSITERLSALRDSIFRESSSSSAQNNQQASAKKNRSQSSRSQASQQANRYETAPRTESKGLIPKGLFARGQEGNASGNNSQATASPRVTNSRRAGSAAANATPRRNARTVQKTPDAEGSESIVSDLPAKSKTKMSSSDQTTEVSDSKKQVVVSEQAVRLSSRDRGSFDIHRALVGEKSEQPTQTQDAEQLVDEIARQRVEELSADKDVQSLPSVEDSQLAPEVVETLPDVEEPQTVVNEYEQEETYPETGHQAIESDGADPFDRGRENSFSTNPMRNGGVGQTPEFIEQTAPLEEVDLDQIEGELLLSYQQPVIVSHVEGPRSILVGREASYQVTLENTSDVKAMNLSAAVRVPEWAEVIDVMSTGGVVERGEEATGNGVLNWQLHELAANSSATLRLRLIPRSGRPLQLGVQWSQAPIASQTIVEVQEPKLQIELSGPQEVLFGTPQRYRLVLRNPGTGVAENVVVQIVPPGGDPASPTTQAIGPLLAGEVKDMELELTAREAGELLMQASVVADGGLSADASKKVLCRKPELQVDWRGPDQKYAGTESAYYIRVQNPGTAMTEPVTVTFEIPDGAQFVTASDGHVVDAASGTVSWRLSGIGVNETQYMQVRCQMARPGLNRFNVIAETDTGDLSDMKTIQTNIVALADLKLEVIDPQGPLPIGEAALYEIRVRNRGLTAAKGVSIVGLFSDGINPVSVEGAQYTERDGRVTFHPIKSLPAKKEIVLRIRAKASEVGTHIFRAEVVCQDLDIKLAAEETTRFFKDEYGWEDSRTPYSAENDEAVSR